jgi:hypothetical protein
VVRVRQQEEAAMMGDERSEGSTAMYPANDHKEVIVVPLS